jgi:hypothetical protein
MSVDTLNEHCRLLCYLTRENVETLQEKYNLDAVWRTDVFEDQYDDYTHRVFDLTLEKGDEETRNAILALAEEEKIYVYQKAYFVYIPGEGRLNLSRTYLPSTTDNKPIINIEKGFIWVQRVGSILVGYLNYKHAGYTSFESQTSYLFKRVALPKGA